MKDEYGLGQELTEYTLRLLAEREETLQHVLADCKDELKKIHEIKHKLTMT